MGSEERDRDSLASPISISLLNASSNPYNLMNGSTGSLEIRLFYVRFVPCVIDSVPERLTLCYLRREIGFSLEINGSRVPASEVASISLRRDRLNVESSEVTYVSTQSVRITGGVEFEVCENDKMVTLCGSLERMEGEWSIDCYMAAAAMESGNSSFFQPKLGVSSPGIEVYIAGCCGGTPVILTKTIHVSPRRRLGLRHSGMLDSIPEDEEIQKDNKLVPASDDYSNTSIRQRKLQIAEAEVDDYEADLKIGRGYYSEDMYTGEDGQLSWFNAGVRVGVGIGLGMCLGIGIGVGLLMRSYQATTRNFRRRFL